MSVNVDSLGNSVYLHNEEYETRARAPMYVAARAQASALTHTGTILDLGCNDGTASHDLTDGLDVIAVDLAASALKAYKAHSDRVQLVHADINHLPFRQDGPLSDARPDVAMVLDVLEHVSWDEAVTILHGLQEILAPEHSLIISMPIISSASLNTWAERWSMARSGQRPATGLYDRTHQILTSSRGHERLFRTGGYVLTSAFRTLSDGSVVGATASDRLPVAGNESVEETEQDGQPPESSINISLANVVRGFRHPRHALSRVSHALPENSRAYAISQRLLEFQGLYILKPDSPQN